MSNAKYLACRECKREYPLEPTYVCEFCFGPLEVVYDYREISKKISPKKIDKGPTTIWRYKELLPIGSEPVDLGAGFTPLLKAGTLAEELGLKHLYLKNDTVNPTYSFKDRVVSVAITKAKEFGFETVACASTGNLANAVAAHAAKAKLNAYIFVPANLEKGKVLSSAIYAPTLVGVEGSYDEVNRLCSEIANEFNWAFVNINIRPYYAEGSKTLGYETVEQLGWKTPDHLVIPVASGSLLTKIYKGIRELQTLGLVEESAFKISGAQAQGCAPIVDAFKRGSWDIRPVKPQTIAKSLAIGNPADGYYALKTVRETEGYLEEVSDEEVVEGIILLAQTEGIFAETAAGVTIAVLKKLVRAGKIKKDDVTVAYITGAGLKTLEAVENAIELPTIIAPTIESFKEKVLVLTRENYSL